MQSFATTAATTTLSARPRRTNAHSHNRSRNHGLAASRVGTRPNILRLLATPVQPAPNGDFHLDTFFNHVWMSGPHVFSFARDGTVVRPETYRAEPYPGYRASAASSSGRNVCSAGLPLSSSSLVPRTSVSKAPRRPEKSWKNIAISEQDDAEFAAREAEAEVRARSETKGRLMGLVHTWPPRPLPVPCAGCKVLAVRGRRAEGPAVVPALSYRSSRESQSGVVPVARMGLGRKDVACRKEAPLEKNVGVGRLQRKAPGALLLTGM